jgi:hypothetical protein
MARRGDNTFLVVAAALAFAAWQLFKPKGAGPATSVNGTKGGGVPGSPYQVTVEGTTFTYGTPYTI